MVALIRRWLALAALLAGCLGCNLLDQRRPTPTVTLIPSPQPGVTQLILPTATPGPSETPLGGQFAPTATLQPTPTQIPLPTVVPASETPQTETLTPGPSTGPLQITLIEFNNRRAVDQQGRVAWTATVHASGGNGEYTYYHDGKAQVGPIFPVYGTEGAAFVHTIAVRSSDGQQVQCSYYIPPEERSYYQKRCDG